MGTTGEVVAREPRRRALRAAVLLAAALVLTLLAGSVTTLAWASGMRDEGRLLPGTTLAGVDVSGLTVDDARGALEDVLADRLDRPLQVSADDVTVTATPRELGASTDLDQVLAAAVARTTEAGFTDLVRGRWLGGVPSGEELDVALDRDVLDAFVAELVATVDRDAADAEVDVDGDELTVVPATDGRTLDPEATADRLLAAVLAADDAVDLDVEVVAATVATDTAERAADAARAAADAALDRAVTVRLGGTTARATARELGAGVDLAPLVAAGLAGDLPTVGDVDVTPSEEALRGLIDRVAAGQERRAEDAQVTYRGGAIEVSAERDGAAVDRGVALASLRDAFGGAADTVTLELATVRPRVTRASVDTVVVLERSERTVALYRGGERVKEWPVAVGAPTSPTPTGQFTIGAKRFEPTWVNPAPTRWGRDLPARMGPGPDNPLGVRALNWNDASGRDTLIRFHGTPNEASIGSATSNGCVRMFNADVIDLYDRVSVGTVVVSVP